MQRLWWFSSQTLALPVNDFFSDAGPAFCVAVFYELSLYGLSKSYNK